MPPSGSPVGLSARTTLTAVIELDTLPASSVWRRSSEPAVAPLRMKRSRRRTSSSCGGQTRVTPTQFFSTTPYGVWLTEPSCGPSTGPPATGRWKTPSPTCDPATSSPTSECWPPKMPWRAREPSPKDVTPTGKGVDLLIGNTNEVGTAIGSGPVGWIFVIYSASRRPPMGST